MMLHADSSLAARIEAAVVEDFVALAEQSGRLFPEDRPDILEVAGGVALFLGAGSPMNQATGLGFSGPVKSASIASVEDFYTRRGADASLMLAPLAHPSLVDALSSRGWRPSGFENVLGMEISADRESSIDAHASGAVEPDEIVIIEASSDEERRLWARVNIEGFMAPLDPTPGHTRLASAMAARPDVTLLLAMAQGRLAGSAALRIRGGDGWLLADSTLPGFRRRGIQQALQRHRLKLAAEAACGFVFSEARPGSVSQRNMERLGFGVLYTRTDVVAPMGGDAFGSF